MPSKKIEAYEIAQSSLISSLLFLPGRISDVAGLLDPEDFSDGRMKTIWETLVDLYRRNEKISMASVVQNLNVGKRLEQAGGVDEVQRLYNDGAVSASMTDIDTWSKIVKNSAANNRLKTFGSELAGKASQPGNARKLIESSRNKLDNELISLATDTDQIGVADYFDTYLNDLEDRVNIYKETDGDPLAAQHGIPSGFPTIDKNTGGFLPGQVTTVGARTGIGKSFFLVDAALNAAHAGASVLFFSLEMLLPELMNRFISASTSISLWKLQHGSLDDSEVEIVKQAKEDFLKLKIEIDTTPEINLDHIRSKAQKQASSPDGLDLVILDYIQLMKTNSGGGENRERQVADVSRGMKLLSMRLKVPVLQAVMLNRLQKGDEDPMPRIDDIRESNSIAQDSSVIILIHRDKTKGANSMEPATFIIGKNRNGADNIRFECNSLLKYATFKEKVTETKIGDEDSDDDDIGESVDSSEQNDLTNASTSNELDENDKEVDPFSDDEDEF